MLFSLQSAYSEAAVHLSNNPYASAPISRAENYSAASALGLKHFEIICHATEENRLPLC